MSIYQVPFTSHLEMWSPSPSISNFSSVTPTTVTREPYFDSRLYHHEPIFYPTECILCGLPHTRMQSSLNSPPVTTPAPTPPRRRSRIVHRKSHKKYIYSIRFAIHKFLRICTIALKAPLVTKRHVYPVVKREMAECQTSIQTRK